MAEGEDGGEGGPDLWQLLGHRGKLHYLSEVEPFSEAYLPLLPDYLASAGKGHFAMFLQKVQGCEVCGVVMHESCARKVPQDCRPVAEAGDRMLHLWKPAGVVLHDSTGEVKTIRLFFFPLYGRTLP